MKLSAVKKRLADQQSACYQSPADFVSDIRLVFGNLELQVLLKILMHSRPPVFFFFFISHLLSYCNKIFPLQPEPEITVAARKLKELLEKHLRIIFPDQTFPEIKLETLSDFPSEFMSWQYVRVCLTVTRRAFSCENKAVIYVFHHPLLCGVVGTHL